MILVWLQADEKKEDLETGPINYNIPEDSLYYILKQSVYKYLVNKKRGEKKKTLIPSFVKRVCLLDGREAINKYT